MTDVRDDLLSSPDSAAYRAATTPHNATVVQRPAMVAQARSADDVVDAGLARLRDTAAAADPDRRLAPTRILASTTDVPTQRISSDG